jgi:hypothetical protein
MRKLLFFGAVCWLLCAGGPRAIAEAVSFEIRPGKLLIDAGKTGRAQARIAVTGAPGAKVEALWTNVGKLSPAKAAEAGLFTSEWTSPAMGFPTVVVMRADVAVGDKIVRRWAALPVSIRLPVSVQATKGDGVQIFLGGEEYGPVKARKTGEVQIPVVVPPGAGSYTVTRTDEYNVTKSDTRSFALPRVKRLFLHGPQEASAGDEVILEAFLLTKKGTRYEYPTQLLGNCPGASLEEIEGGKSVHKLRFKLSGRTGEITCHVFLKSDPKVRATHSLEVDISRRLALELRVEPRVLRINSGKVAKVEVSVADLFGNVADTPKLEVTANGRPLSMSRSGAGQYRGWLYAPKRRQPGDRIRVRADAPGARPVQTDVRLLGGSAVKLTAAVKPRRVMADGKRWVMLEVEATDKHGMPAADKELEITSEQGRVLFIHRVRPGLFRARFRPERNASGGEAVLTIQTRRAPAIKARVQLERIPQQWLLTPVLGGFGDFLRTAGIGFQLRFEWAAHQGRPNVFVGAALLLGPDFSLEDGEGRLIDHVGFSAGAAAHARLRMVNTRRFGLDVVVDVGVLGLYASYRQQFGTVLQRNDAGRAAFTAAVGLEAGLVTTGQQEVFALLQARYLTGRFEDAEGQNRVILFGGLGYRFTL